MEMRKGLIIVIALLLCIGAYSQALLNKAAVDTRLDSVRMSYDLPHEFTGKGVIIGLTDWGFDYTHPVFYDTSMTHYRILRAWDQFKTSGPAPAGFNYGTEYVGQEALLNAKCDTSNIYDYAYHGTHCAGIAGGAGAGTVYRGVAVDAEFLFATLNLTDSQVIDAWRWMYDVAQQEGKRLVVSMSWGLYYLDNMDGTGALADEMRRLTDLGVLFVTSGGNNGDVNFHLDNTFTQLDTIYTQFVFPHSSIGSDITMMNSADSPFSFSLFAMDNSFNILSQTDFYKTVDGGIGDTVLIVGSDTVRYSYVIQSSNEYNDRPQVLLTVYTNTNYKFGLAVAASEGEFHAWNVARIPTNYGNWGGDFLRPSAHPEWKAGNSRYGISTPGNIDCGITVASHYSRHVAPSGIQAGGGISNFSSYGPSFGNTMKPDISAPGTLVVSALSSYTNTYSGVYSKSVTFNDRLYRFVPLSGTSMACPFVAGVAALVLQANPNLSPAQVKDILLQTAYNDQFTEAAGTERFGSGKVNAYQAVLAALQTVGVDQYATPHTSSFTVFPNPADDHIYITANIEHGNFRCEICDMSGRVVMRDVLPQGVNMLNVSSLKSGVYLVRLDDGTSVSVNKLIVR